MNFREGQRVILEDGTVIWDDQYGHWEIKPLPEELKKRAVEYLLEKLHPKSVSDLREGKLQAEPGFHMFGGMSIRNLLREIIKDDELPANIWSSKQMETGNWDDYYQEVLEAVTG